MSFGSNVRNLKDLGLFLVAAISPLLVAQSQPVTTPISRAAQSRVLTGLGRLPLNFEAQPAGGPAGFVSRGPGYSLSVETDGAVLVLDQGGDQGGDQGVASHAAGPRIAMGGRSVSDSAKAPVVLRMSLLGANTHANLRAENPQEGASNYFLGNDPSRWRTNVQHFSKVRASAVYPGIDLVYYGNPDTLEHDFIVAPGADAGKIAMKFDGASGLRINNAGDLLISAGNGEVEMHRPVVYQGAGENRREVSGAFELRAANEVGFRIGAYDHSRELVVDPVISYSTYLGGSNPDLGYSVTTDKTGNIILVGLTRSSDFPTKGTIQPFNSTVCGGLACADIFVAKFNAAGTALAFSTYIGGSNYDYFNLQAGLALDAAGNIVVAGSTESSDFPTTAGAYQKTFGGDGPGGFGDGFVFKLAANGSALIYSTYIGGNSDDGMESMAMDSAGNTYVTLLTLSANFPTTTGAYQTTCANLGTRYCGVIVKLNPTGSSLVFSTYLAGTTTVQDSAFAIALDAANNVYLSGLAGSADFPTTVGAFDRTCGTDGACNSTFDAFAAKLNAAGSKLMYSTFLGGSGFDWADQMVVDKAGNAYVIGGTLSTDFPTSAAATQKAFGGTVSGCASSNAFHCGDLFIVKLNPTGSKLAYSTYFGGSGDEYPTSLALDLAGDLYVSGVTTSTNIAVKNPVQAAYGGDPSDGLLAELNPAGSAFLFASYLGGNDRDVALGIHVDRSGNLFVASQARSTNFPVTATAFQKICVSCPTYADASLTKISPKADLSVTNAAPATVKSGAMLTYTITGKNIGPDTALSVAMANPVPAGTTFQSVTLTGATCIKPVVGGTGAVTCTVPVMLSGATVTETLAVKVTAKAGASVSDTAKVSFGGTDPVTTNNSAAVKTTVN